MIFDFFTNNFYILLGLWIAIAVITFFYLFFVTAPYGRHASSDWGPSMDARWGWIVMESPSVFLIGGLCIFFRENLSLVSSIFVLIYIFHYFHRTLIWPFIAEIDGKIMPIYVASLAIVFIIFGASATFLGKVLLSNSFPLRIIVKASLIANVAITTKTKLIPSDKFIVLKVKRGISDKVSWPTDANINPKTHIIIAFKKLPFDEKAATAVKPKIIKPK